MEEKSDSTISSFNSNFSDMKSLVKIHLAILVLMFSSLTLFAQEKQDEKIRKSEAVIRDFLGMKENIPALLMKKAEGIVIIPNLIKAGLGIGGQRGRGVAMVKKADGTWSDPVFVTLTGGSIGFQAGVQSIDLVMVFTKGSILTSLAKGEFTLGGDIGVAAGPVGRSSSATTDTQLDAEVYSYSRSKGLFAGLTLNGSKLAPDNDGNKAFYKTNYTAATIFSKKTASKQPEVMSLKRAVRGFQ
jgi:lipid-binding SYLF domain-containing protein